MNLGQIRQRFRQRADDLVAPYLWDDPEVDAYANEAEAEAADRAYLLFERTNPLVSQIVAHPGRSRYPLHPSIIEIDRVIDRDTGYRLAPIPLSDLDQIPSWEDVVGRPSHYAVQGHELTVYRRPTEDVRLRVLAYRLPLHPMKGPSDKPEIRARWHERLIDWMLYRAYSKRDADAGDTALADRHLGAFVASFGDREDADTERKQAETRKPRVRVSSEWQSRPYQGFRHHYHCRGRRRF